MKRAIGTKFYAQADDYFGEFHAVGKRLNVRKRDAHIVVE
jgi:hypothetical protein